MSKRHSATSATKSESANLNNEAQTSDGFEDDTTQLSMAPELQVYLARVSQESGCWGTCLPIPFERAASRSWWDPTFDSELLEEQYRHSSFTHNRLKFRYAILYILLTSTSWFFYFIIAGWTTSSSTYWPISCTLLSVMIIFISSMFFLTFSKFFASRMLAVSLNVSMSLCVLGLLFVVLPSAADTDGSSGPVKMSLLGHFSLCIESLLLIYTVMPLRLYISLSIGITYSVLFELLTWTYLAQPSDTITVAVRCMAHGCIHLIGLHILIMTNVRLRNTFMKVGQSLLVRRQLESEQKLKEKMIESLMPARVAKLVLNDDENFMRSGMDASRSSNGGGTDINSLFRPFNMNRLENVSILFADIVGFTRMSSTKNADELVAILNTLFQRFDLLCNIHRCEKISTLGDCYYCVSGCPEPEEAHAKCAVEMGMGMINFIKQFDEENNEGINIRVGVHTGTVLCGIVGTRRFRFDVWSNDVTLANRMESTGKPGLVHISESTQKLLPNIYLLEEGEQVFGLRTYFIIGRTSERLTTTTYNNSLKAIDRPHSNLANATRLQLVVSPPTSPPSISPQTRPRVLSCCDSSTSTLKPQNLLQNPALLSPDTCKFKASSLPSILDSENEQQEEASEKKNGDNIITPTSTASSGRYSIKLKNWKISKFLRKNSDSSNKQEAIAADEPTRVSIANDSLANVAGYSQIPMIIETKKDLPPPLATDSHEESKVYLEEPRETIDVKSYISQSRSDVGQFDYSPNEFTYFMRTGSYRSQYGHAPNELSFLSRAGSYRSKRGKSPINDIMPSERARSATVVLGQLDRKRLDAPAYRLSCTLIDDQISTGPSINSRKDSGIKSTSRRSSIMQIEHRLPSASESFHQYRVSGYFTSSQSSINSPQYSSRLHAPFLGKCIQNLRKQSDRQLIRCVQENSKSRRSYFIKPPLSAISLFFADEQMEHEYRTNVHATHATEDTLTMADATLNTFFDIFVSALIFLTTSTGLFLLGSNEGTSPFWICMFCLFCLVQISAAATSFRRISYTCDYYLKFIPKWYRWNVFGGILVCLPIASVLVNSPLNCPFGGHASYLYSVLLFVGLVHFCNFTQLNCWMKNILATVFGITYIISSLNCPLSVDRDLTDMNNRSNASMETAVSSDRPLLINNCEILLDILLLLVLVWILNREFEICYRLSFHTNHMATRDRYHVQSLKNQADWLIYNIVPEHVAEQLKQNAKYTEHFKNVAIIFASIVNFNEMYDESYLGGKEFLRVLNELIGDFDELLTLPQFQSVEKIKTIGSTFMAASGLNSKMRLQQTDEHFHLYALMDFAIAMQHVVDNFNRNLLEFNLILRIGYNFGDVTAAVIGETMLYYDIWGDAVNVASRMDSTGVNERIQVGEQCLEILRKKYEFEPRGAVYVKGKDNMNVFLLLRKLDDVDDIPHIDTEL